MRTDQFIKHQIKYKLLIKLKIEINAVQSSRMTSQSVKAMNASHVNIFGALTPHLALHFIGLM